MQTNQKDSVKLNEKNVFQDGKMRNINEHFQKTMAKIKKFSIIEKKLKKNAELRDKEIEKHKANSLKLSVFIGLFCWLLIGAFINNVILGGAIATVIIATIFILLIQAPIIRKKKYAKQVEAQLPLFLLSLANEIRLGKSFSKAIKDACLEKGVVSGEFEKVVSDLNKGISFSDALSKMNERLGNMTIRRALSNLNNLQIQGTRDTSGLKKLAQEMLLKQRIESKEFSAKLVVYALVFIAVSAIVPAMFQSFLLIGSYFMSIQFTPIEAFLICICGFPAIDAAVLFMIESKTPIFLRR